MNTKNDFTVSIDHSKCIQCRLCAIECPSRTASADHIHSDHSSPLCDKCFHCYAICPQNAIRIQGFDEEQVKDGQKISLPDFQFFLKKRRSCRKYLRKPIPEDYLDKLIESTRYCPSGGNVQDLSITVIKDPLKRELVEEEIIRYYDKIIRFLRIPLVRLFMKFFGDAKVKETANDKDFFKKIEGIYARLKAGENCIFWDAPAVMIFHSDRLLPTACEDCILAAYNVVLSANALDLGSCFVSLSQQAIASSNRIKELIGIPKPDFIYSVLVLGFPAVRYRRIPPRKEKQVMLG